MIRTVHKTKVEYGDFQTPLELAEKICQKLRELGVTPDVIIEPTCGVGNFIEAAVPFFPLTSNIFGVEINPSYLQEMANKKQALKEDKRVEIKQGNFFKFDDVFNSLESSSSYRIGYRNNILIRDIETFDKLSNLYDANADKKWRSGLKHDC